MVSFCCIVSWHHTRNFVLLQITNDSTDWQWLLPLSIVIGWKPFTKTLCWTILHATPSKMSQCIEAISERAFWCPNFRISYQCYENHISFWECLKFSAMAQKLKFSNEKMFLVSPKMFGIPNWNWISKISIGNSEVYASIVRNRWQYLLKTNKPLITKL